MTSHPSQWLTKSNRFYMLGGCPWRVPEEGRKYYLTLIIAKEHLSPSCSWTRDEIKAMPRFLKTMLTLSDCLKLPPKRGVTIPMVFPPSILMWLHFGHLAIQSHLQTFAATVFYNDFAENGLFWFFFFFCKTTPFQTMGSFNDCDVHLTTVFTLRPLT